MKLFADAGFGVLQRGLLRLQEAGNAGLALDLLVEKCVAQLRDGDGVGAGVGVEDAGVDERLARGGGDSTLIDQVASDIVEVAGIGRGKPPRWPRLEQYTRWPRSD